MNSEEVEKQFRAELQELLNKWGAEIELVDKYYCSRNSSYEKKD